MASKIQSVKQKFKKLRANSNRKRLHKNTIQVDLNYKRLYENSPILERTINTRGIIIACNKEYVKHFGYSKKEILNTSLYDHTAEKSIKDMVDDMKKWRKT